MSGGDNNKMKGLLKGLRIISQIFENGDGDEQQEFEIGNPTDVKHVAHIGSDGPTDNNPSWINEFKSTQGLSSSELLNTNKDIHSKVTDDSDKCVLSDTVKRDSRSGNDQDNTHELPLPKSSKQQSHSGGNMRESHAKEKSDKPRQQKRNSKNSISNDSFDESKLTTSEQPMNPMVTNSIQLQGNTNDNLSPKSTHSKKSKDVQGANGSSKSRTKQLKESNSNEGTHSRSGSKSKESNSTEGTHSRSNFKSKESNSNEGTHSRSGSKSKESNSNEVSHSRHSSKSRELNSNDGSHSRTSSKSKDSSSKEGQRSKSKELNSNERDPSKSSSKPRNKHRLSEEGGQLKRGSNEDILRSYVN